MSKNPLWVQSPSIQSLLNVLVNRLDGSEVRGTEKPQSVALTEKTWPALYLAQLESEKEGLWGQVIQMCQWGWLQVKPAAAGRSGSGYAQAPRVTVLDTCAVRHAVGRPERVKSSAERWREAIDRNLDAPAAVKNAAGDYCIDTPDHSMDEVVQQLNKLKILAGKSLLLRELCESSPQCVVRSRNYKPGSLAMFRCLPALKQGRVIHRKQLKSEASGRSI